MTDRDPPSDQVDIYRKSTSPSDPKPVAPTGTSTQPPPVQDDLQVTVANALKLTSWERIRDYPYKPCVLSSLSTGLLAASAVSGVMLIRRRPFSSCANWFVATSTIVAGTAYGLCHVRLHEQKMKVIEVQQEIRRKHEDQVLKDRLEARLKLREEDRAKKREDWLAGLKPNMASSQEVPPDKEG